MTNEQWQAFDSFRTRFRERCAAWSAQAGDATGWMATLEREAAEADATPEYPLENPIVYNHALDAITREDRGRAHRRRGQPGQGRATREKPAVSRRPGR